MTLKTSETGGSKMWQRGWLCVGESSVRYFRDLKVWQRAHQLTLSVYEVTQQFPKDELFGLTSQIRRASASIGANIAEGCGRESNAEFTRFLSIALSSASELEYHLILAADLSLLTPKAHQRFDTEVRELKMMLHAFIQAVRPTRREGQSPFGRPGGNTQ